ncbi:MAG: hypothetical protein NTZ78_10775 [Candidatus Aureabacteria bacterium]|nr:hypothetical protein [Candidatus Auribacterota bacterium]
MFRTYSFVRDIDFDDLLERFFISAVLAILGIRIFLSLTNYPQLGGKGLHIAHMLWGGLLMLASTVLLLTFLNRSVKRFSAVLAGVGFGTFIDELGKFITSDNNYFFRPTVALIYIIFILLFLFFRALREHRAFSQTEYLSNSIELLRESTTHDLNVEDKHRLLYYLLHSDRSSHMTQMLEKLAVEIRAIPARHPGFFARIRSSMHSAYARFVLKPWFAKGVTVFFVLEALLNLLILLVAILLLRKGRFSAPALTELLGLDISDILSIVSSAVAGVLAILGAFAIRRSRLAAYELFRKAMLISIFFVQVFSFYHHQMHAFLGLIVNLLLLSALNSMIEDEKSLESS